MRASASVFTRLSAALLVCIAATACEKQADNAKPAESTAKQQPASAAAPRVAPAQPAAPMQPTTPTPNPATMPPGHPPTSAPTAAATPGAAALEGITMKVPEGWKPAPTPPGQMGMGPKAVYILPPAEGAEGEASVRITHFPGMKGMDDMNIDRWLAQVKKSDGSAFTREEAKISVQPMGAIRLTIVDLDGSVKTDMPGASEAAHGQRMIAAIVDHPKGPHFVKVLGPASTIAKHADEVYEFLTSAKVTE